MAFQIAAIPMTLSDLQVHSPIAGLLNGIFLYSCAAADNISTEIAHCVVPL